ncbi:MAG: serine protease [Coleofasciculus sp. B1-GNL1-01]|uniref:S1 family peptidase n=1 Tax=Coleofasciculus sp. B1-GNL1-01 TaxID=3068484 RepID=UPI0032FE3BDE
MWHKTYSGLSAALIGSSAIVMVQPQVAVSQTLDEQAIASLAKEVTVIINGQNPGSGVLIAKQGNTYYVLTANHVVPTPDEYEIITFDGTKHTLDYDTVKKLPDVDLAVVQFTSNQSYRVAQLGNSDTVVEGATIYISGWPHPGEAITQRIFQITSGKISGRSQSSLEDGYALVYTNVKQWEITVGLSFWLSLQIARRLPLIALTHTNTFICGILLLAK